MLTGFSQTSATSSLLLSLSISTFALQVRAASASHPPSDHRAKRGSNNPLGIDWSPAPSPEDGPPGAADAIRNPAYLPAQIGGIVGSYAFSLVVVALLLLALSKKRREHLRAAEELEEVWEDDYTGATAVFQSRDELWQQPLNYPNGVYPPHLISHEQPKSPGHGHVRNFSLPSPTSTRFEVPRFDFSGIEASRFEDPRYAAPRFDEPQEAPSPSSYFVPSPTSTTRGPLGQDPYVDQDVVQRDRAMAQSELEQMYKYVMEQEEAKEAGVEFRAPMVPAEPRISTMTSSSKKEKNKPASLNLNKGEKTQSRTSSILSALKSPRKKKQMQGISISSPIMTPMSGTFPQHVGEEMNTIPPRQYAPAIPPPVPMNRSQASFAERRNTGHIAPLMTPDLSPESTQSIDERIGAIATAKGKDREHRSGGEDVSDEEDEGHDQVGQLHSRHISLATTEADPVSAVSETSQSGLLRNTPGLRTSGLPTSPKPGVNRFPSLPSSPKPGASFSRPNAPSAVRTGGMLPLRAYENAMVSPTSYDRTVKETVFQRAGPMSPGGMHTARTPLTGNPVPYSPYQPFSPVIPITPSLVTKADRKRMKRMEPKTPTLQMVKSDDELW
ncbi:hypothetical protein N0V93_002525 [Gnomoniopsis smithogilvyi]|uniref:Uncharacterized protein n=1 Tax=Gnomoniopsis smithogilvyi TaxID=1191159 RepID=A0A9W8YVH3_9PEZI|nr:hypothetical protein N0V93_002525 [Gnomoniopsis smithogilvyi]